MLDALGDLQPARRRVALHVRRIRAHRGITQETAAHAAGIAVRHLQKIEAAQVNVTLDTLAKLAAALDVDIAELLVKLEKEETP